MSEKEHKCCGGHGGHEGCCGGHNHEGHEGCCGGHRLIGCNGIRVSCGQLLGLMFLSKLASRMLLYPSM